MPGSPTYACRETLASEYRGLLPKESPLAVIVKIVIHVAKSASGRPTHRCGSRARRDGTLQPTAAARAAERQVIS